MIQRWWLVRYPNGVKLIEYLSDGEMNVKHRATGIRPQLVIVTIVEDKEETTCDKQQKNN